MKQRILIVGAGFAGMWSALSAVRQLDRQGATTSRSRCSRRSLSCASARVSTSLTCSAWRRRWANCSPRSACVSCRAARSASTWPASGWSTAMPRARRRSWTTTACVLAAGSGVWRPASVVGIDAAFDVDQLEDALRLEAHLHALRDLPDSPARNTVVVAGGGFTGIETATEMPARLRAILGEKAALRVIVVDRGAAIGASMGADLSGLIAEASAELGVEWCLGRSVAAVDAEGVTLDDGQRIEAKTVVWTVGVRASTLTGQIPGERDAQGRLHVDRNLKVLGLDDVYATGDVARAATDDLGNHALMTCQHAIALGRSAGNNVAADLLGVEPIPYSQVKYVTCLDLGGWGAVFTEGWDRQVRFVREEGKKIKTEINGVWIYPPAADRAVALAAADPLIPVVA
ncbi:FAD-dependent oxidoreductase [Pseudomonas aeruginosa]|nr:FAD-dependent oxidoreductase [Pseudomonas aeruginosa]